MDVLSLLAGLNALPSRRIPEITSYDGERQGLPGYLAEHQHAVIVHLPYERGLEPGLTRVTQQVDVYGVDETTAKATERDVRRRLAGRGGRQPGPWRYEGTDPDPLPDGESLRLILTFHRTTKPI